MSKDVHCLCTSEVSDNENTGKPQHAQKLKLYNSWKIKGVEISIWLWSWKNPCIISNQMISILVMRKRKVKVRIGVCTWRVDVGLTLWPFHVQRKSKPAVAGSVYPTVPCTG